MNVTLWVLVAVGFSAASMVVFVRTREIGKALAVQMIGAVCAGSLICADVLRFSLNT